MKSAKKFIGLFLVIVMIMPSVVFAAEVTDTGWTTSGTNGSAVVSRGGTDITLECLTSSRARAQAEAVSPALEDAREKFDIYLSFDITFEDFSANKRATVVLQNTESQYAMNFFTFTGNDNGIELELFDETVSDLAIENGSKIEFNTEFNIVEKTICITANDTEIYNGESNLLSYLSADNLNVSFKSIFTTSLIGSSSVQIENFSLVPGLFIELITDEISYMEGTAAIINMTLPESGWDKVTIYCNNEYLDEIEFGTTSYGFLPDTYGEFDIKAVISGADGKTAEAEITLFYERNEKPTVSVQGGTEITFADDAEKQITINAEDADGTITKVEIYRFSELVSTLTEAPYVVDLDELGVGMGENPITITAYDNFGATSSVSVSVVVTKYTSSLLFEESDFVSNESIYGSGMTITRQRGFAMEEVVDEEYGTSLVIGMDENCDTENFTGSQYTFVQSAMNLNYDFQEMEFEIKITEIPAKDNVITFGIRRKDAAVASMMTVCPGGLKFGSVTVPCTDGWNHVKIELSIKSGNQYYNAYVNGEPVLTNRAIDLGEAPTHFRFFTSTDATNIGAVAIDNISVSSLMESPRIIGIGNHTEIADGKIDFDTTEIGIFLSGVFNRADLNGDTVQIMIGNSVLETELIRFNSDSNCIEVTMTEALRPNTEYKIVIDAAVRFDEEITLGNDMEYRFVTQNEGITVDEVICNKQGDDLKISVTVNDSEKSAKAIYTYANLFDADGRIVGTNVFKAELSSQTTENEFEFTVSDSSGYKPYVFIADGILMNEIYFSQEYELN